MNLSRSCPGIMLTAELVNTWILRGCLHNTHMPKSGFRWGLFHTSKPQSQTRYTFSDDAATTLHGASKIGFPWCGNPPGKMGQAYC